MQLRESQGRLTPARPAPEEPESGGWGSVVGWATLVHLLLGKEEKWLEGETLWLLNDAMRAELSRCDVFKETHRHWV